MSYDEHQKRASRAVKRLRIALLTSSDSRTCADDESGDLIERRLAEDHTIVARLVVRDEVPALRRAADALCRHDPDVVIVNGGTGLSPRDVTIEALRPWFTKELPGFGESFRALSQPSVGTGSWLSRATAGVVDRRGRARLFVLLPGSPDACRLAVDRLLRPELAHAVSILRGVRPHG